MNSKRKYLLLFFFISLTFHSFSQKEIELEVLSSATQVFIDDDKVKGKTLEIEKANKYIYQARLEKEGYKTQYEFLAYKFRYPFEIRNKLVTRKENQRYMRVTATPFKMEEEQLIYTALPWSHYQKDMKDGKMDSYPSHYDRPVDEKIEIENSMFTDPVNKFLKTLDLIDTVSTFYSLKYNTLDLSGKLYSAYVYHVACNYTHKFAQADLAIEWTITNALNDTLYVSEVEALSGKYLFDIEEGSTDLSEELIEEGPLKENGVDIADYYAMADAYEVSLLKLIGDPEVQKLLDQQLKEEDIEASTISSPTRKVEDLEQALEASVTVKVDDGHGSGFFINNSGFVLTNYHVIHDAKKVEVIVAGETVPAEVIKYSKLADLALLKTEVENEYSFTVSSEKISKMGQEIFAIGTPKSIDLPSTLSKGIISGFRKSGENQTLIQTDVSINSGNSGGPLISKEGVLLGIVNSKMSGWGVEGISFGLAGEQILSNLKMTYKE